MVSYPTFHFRARTFQITQFINLSWLNHPARIGLVVVPFRIDPVKIPIILDIYLLMYLENMTFYTFDGFFSIAHTFVSLFVIGKRFDLTAFAFVIGEHLWELFQVITGDAVGEDVYCEARFPHIETRGLHAGSGIGTGSDAPRAPCENGAAQDVGYGQGAGTRHQGASGGTAPVALGPRATLVRTI